MSQLTQQTQLDEIEDPILREIYELKELIGSASWRSYVLLLHRHKGFLQLRVNASLKEHSDRLAGEYRARLDEVDDIIKLISARLTELNVKQGERNGSQRR